MKAKENGDWGGFDHDCRNEGIDFHSLFPAPQCQ
jgi:hypothetical protein